jgi:hypothetical protein
MPATAKAARLRKPLPALHMATRLKYLSPFKSQIWQETNLSFHHL